MAFPSPAADYQESRLSLDQHLIHHPSATFFCIASGDSMTEAGIHDGAILVVDRSLKALDGDIVVVIFEGEHMVRQLNIRRGRVLLSANSDTSPISIEPDQDLEVWGVVASAVNQFRRVGK